MLSARVSLELSECKVCLTYEVILEWIKLYKVPWKPWGLSGSPQTSSTLRLGVEWREHFVQET
jgi:hypothetical protein